MHYRQYQPCAELSGSVKCFWTLESNGNEQAGKPERIFPDGCMELVFHYGDKFRINQENGRSELQPRSFMFGQLDRFIELEPSGSTGILGVRFFPHSASEFMDAPLNCFRGNFADIQELFGNEGPALLERILNCSTNTERIYWVQEFLLKRKKKSADLLIRESVKKIMKSNGQIPVSELARYFSISKRQLERRFEKSAGTTPKMLSKIFRFQRALQLAERHNSLTALSLDSGYYDQAHFIRDFKDLTGMTPG